MVCIQDPDDVCAMTVCCIIKVSALKTRSYLFAFVRSFPPSTTGAVDNHITLQISTRCRHRLTELNAIGCILVAFVLQYFPSHV